MSTYILFLRIQTSYYFFISDDLQKLFKESDTKYVITVPEVLEKVKEAINDIDNIKVRACADLVWGQRVGTPTPYNHQNIGFLSNSCPDPPKNHKATKPAFHVGPSSALQRNAISLAGR